MSSHPENAAEFARDPERAHWHDQAIWYVRKKRDTMVAGVEDWERLREHASQIKLHTLSKLGSYLERFEAQLKAQGAKVHWAVDANQHNEIVLGILKSENAQQVVKSKSMLTEECGLNHFLEERGIEITDTDLGEWIVQLRREPPSHIVMPGIHIKKEEIGELFRSVLGTEVGNDDPAYLTGAARIFLRKKYLSAQAAISGVNFGVAETGALVICTNEGNADLGNSLAPLHIACMGIEKLIPRQKDLGVFLRLLARSATGQPITTYSSHLLGPQPGAKLHVVLVDNGRTKHLHRAKFRRSLACIRCGACLNTCPVYRRSGGYSYNYTIPGPIGAVIAPLRDPKKYASLPFASTLCGSCTDVCPVKINLHEQLLLLREEVPLPLKKRIMLKAGAWPLRHSKIYALLGICGRSLMEKLPRRWVYLRANVWGRSRELPVVPPKTFREMYRERKHGQ